MMMTHDPYRDATAHDPYRQPDGYNPYQAEKARIEEEREEARANRKREPNTITKRFAGRVMKFEFRPAHPVTDEFGNEFPDGRIPRPGAPRATAVTTLGT